MKPYYLKEKLYVGVSGHRDLKKSKMDDYKEEVKSILMKLIRENPDREVIVVSPLADGADRLAVYAAKELELRYEVLLPMPSYLYEKDFSLESLQEYKALTMTAMDKPTVIPLCEGCTEENISKYGEYRDKQYLKTGEEIVDRSNMMLFLWDGKPSGGTGGTGDIVVYTEQKDKSFFIVECEREAKEE
ncbi:hypothetical protein ACM66Z_07125 [Sulfurovum sp. ST-21]|uniref:Uncharacterized protein n=1 Tax=Sulfurovum indicum TaxID=2779528 RepID=A0A7M1S1X0_9BACT|nr:hypothetical protein [Sulfurovum indicum]QOR61224.1 hypothetical protein IMZ28_07120 [Sulfurovum indicum]